MSDVFASLVSTAATPKAQALVADLTEKVEAASEQARKKSAGQKAALYRAVERFLGDLLAADEANTYAYRSLKAKTFSRGPVGYRTFMETLRAFEKLHWVDWTKGKKMWTANGFDRSAPPIATGGSASQFRMTDALRDLCMGAGVTSADFCKPLPECPITLRAASQGFGKHKKRGEVMAFPETEKTALLVEQTKTLNEFLRAAEPSFRFDGLIRVFNQGDTEGFDWNKGGRFYAGYQRTKAKLRSEFTIGGERTAELDIRASFPSTYLGLKGYRGAVDPYGMIVPQRVV